MIITITEWLNTQIEISKRVAKKLIAIRTRVEQYYNLEDYNSKFDYRKQ